MNQILLNWEHNDRTCVHRYQPRTCVQRYQPIIKDHLYSKCPCFNDINWITITMVSEPRHVIDFKWPDWERKR